MVSDFVVLCVLMYEFVCLFVCLPVCFLKRERKDGKDLGGVRGGESMIRIFCMKKDSS